MSKWNLFLVIKNVPPISVKQMVKQLSGVFRHCHWPICSVGQEVHSFFFFFSIFFLGMMDSAFK